MTAAQPRRPIELTRVGWRDAVDLGLIGVRTRPARAVLTAVGIAVGVAALVAVLGISDSSRARLLAEIDRLGTDVLEIAPGQRIAGEQAPLPVESAAMLRRIPGVEQTAMLAALDVSVRRNDLIGPHITGGILVAAADPDLVGATHSRLRSGRFLDAATGHLPVVILGPVAAGTSLCATCGTGHWCGSGTGGSQWVESSSPTPSPTSSTAPRWSAPTWRGTCSTPTWRRRPSTCGPPRTT